MKAPELKVRTGLSYGTRIFVRNTFGRGKASSKTQKIITSEFLDLVESVNGATGKFGEFAQRLRIIYGVDLSPSGMSRSQALLRNSEVLNSRLAQNTANTVAEYLSGRYSMNFDFIVDPALSSAVKSFGGGYYSLLAQSIQDREKLAQSYREMFLNGIIGSVAQNMLAPVLKSRLDAISTKVVLPFLAQRLPAAVGGQIAANLLTKATAAQAARITAMALARGALRRQLTRVAGRAAARRLAASVAGKAALNLGARALAGFFAGAGAGSFLGPAGSLILGLGTLAFTIYEINSAYNKLTRSEFFTEGAEMPSFAELFNPTQLREMYLPNVSLLMNQVERGRESSMTTLFGTEFEESLDLGNPLASDELNSVTSRIYESAHRRFGLDLRRLGVDNSALLSVGTGMLRGMRGGFNEDIAADILTYSAVYSGGSTESVQKSYYRISTTMSDYKNSARLVSDGFEKLFAAAVGNGKPQASQLQLVETLSEFSATYGAATKFNLDVSVNEVAKLYQFLSDDGAINNRVTATPVSNLSTSIDKMLISALFGTSMTSSTLLRSMAVTRDEAASGLTGDAGMLDQVLYGIKSVLNISDEDILNNTTAFNSALMDFYSRQSENFSQESMSALILALRRHASGRRVGEVSESSIQAVRGDTGAVVGAVSSESATLYNVIKRVVESRNLVVPEILKNVATIDEYSRKLLSIIPDLFGPTFNAYIKMTEEMFKIFGIKINPMPTGGSVGSGAGVWAGSGAAGGAGAGSAGAAAAGAASTGRAGAGAGSAGAAGAGASAGGAAGSAGAAAAGAGSAAGTVAGAGVSRGAGSGAGASSQQTSSRRASSGGAGFNTPDFYQGGAIDEFLRENIYGVGDQNRQEVAQNRPNVETRAGQPAPSIQPSVAIPLTPSMVTPSGVTIAANLTEQELYDRVRGRLSGNARDNFTPEFFTGLSSISKEFGIPLDYLLTVLFRESSFNPAAVYYDPESGIAEARGLIQFRKSTYDEVDNYVQNAVSWEDISSLSSSEQLPYVRAYFNRDWVKTRIARAVENNLNDLENLLIDMYLIPFQPAYVGDSTQDSRVFIERPPGTPEENKRHPYYANLGLDKNNDGFITRGDIREAMKQSYRSLIGNATGGYIFNSESSYQYGKKAKPKAREIEIFIPISSTNPRLFVSQFSSKLRTNLRG